jgi:Protein of unknown function (DUF3054)
MRTMTAAVADLCCVVVFVVIGRANHHEADALSGFAHTAWPFLLGLAIGWLATRAWRRPAEFIPTGVGVWLATVAVGMVARVLSGQGIAFAFVLVALVFLGLVMLGWRAISRLAT